MSKCVVMVVGGHAELLQVIGAGHAAACLTSHLYGRQEQGNQHADDRNDDQQLDQRKGTPLICSLRLIHDAPLETHLDKLSRDLLNCVKSQNLSVPSRLPVTRRWPCCTNAKLLTMPS